MFQRKRKRILCRNTSTENGCEIMGIQWRHAKSMAFQQPDVFTNNIRAWLPVKFHPGLNRQVLEACQSEFKRESVFDKQSLYCIADANQK